MIEYLIELSVFNICFKPHTVTLIKSVTIQIVKVRKQIEGAKRFLIERLVGKVPNFDYTIMIR